MIDQGGSPTTQRRRERQLVRSPGRFPRCAHDRESPPDVLQDLVKVLRILRRGRHACGQALSRDAYGRSPVQASGLLRHCNRPVSSPSCCGTSGPISSDLDRTSSLSNRFPETPPVGGSSCSSIALVKKVPIRARSSTPVLALNSSIWRSHSSAWAKGALPELRFPQLAQFVRRFVPVVPPR